MTVGIPAFRIVAYTYNADIHCIYHAERAFGRENGKDWVRENATDSEGNPVHPVFTSDQDVVTVQACGDDMNEIVCLVCGIATTERKIGEPCWNCSTVWVHNWIEGEE